MDVQPGEIIDRYRVDAMLGEGGMASVWRVQHQQLGTWHALKVLRAAWGSTRDRLLQEGRVQARLQHPNIVTVTDVVEVHGSPGLVMEYVAGPNLEVLLASGPIPLVEVDGLARGILAGVAAAHAEGLVHRDLKPSNVLISLSRLGLVPKVADFGIARALGDDTSVRHTRTGFAMGTPGYMSPEQIRDAKGVDARADVFALGCILYEMVTGNEVFTGKDTFDLFTKVCGGKYVPPSETVPGLPSRFADAIRGALEVEVEDRIADCDTLLEIWAGGTSLPAAARGAEESEVVRRARSLSSAPSSRVGSVGSGFSGVGSGFSGTPSQATFAADEPAERPAASGAAPGATPGSAGATMAPGTLLPALGEDKRPAAGTIVAMGAELTEEASRRPSAGSEPTMDPSAPGVGDAARFRPVGRAKFSLPLGLAAAFAVVGLAALGGTAATVFFPRTTGPLADVAAPAPAESASVAPSVAVGPGATTVASVQQTSGLPDVEPAPVEVAPAPETPLRPPSGKLPQSGSPAHLFGDPPAAKVSGGSAHPAPLPPPVAVAPAPTPAPAATAPAEAVAAAPASTAKIRLEGDAKSVYLQSASGNFRPGEVQPGTYRIKVFFEGMDARTVGDVTVFAGDSKTLVCQKALSSCSVQ